MTIAYTEGKLVWLDDMKHLGFDNYQFNRLVDEVFCWDWDFYIDNPVKDVGSLIC